MRAEAVASLTPIGLFVSFVRVTFHVEGTLTHAAEVLVLSPSRPLSQCTLSMIAYRGFPLHRRERPTSTACLLRLCQGSEWDLRRETDRVTTGRVLHSRRRGFWPS